MAICKFYYNVSVPSKCNSSHCKSNRLQETNYKCDASILLTLLVLNKTPFDCQERDHLSHIKFQWKALSRDAFRANVYCKNLTRWCLMATIIVRHPHHDKIFLNGFRLRKKITNCKTHWPARCAPLFYGWSLYIQQCIIARYTRKCSWPFRPVKPAKDQWNLIVR